MSDYVRQNDFSIKDALPSGSAQKIIKGADVDAEFDALVSAVASKLDDITAATTGNVPIIGSSGSTLTDSGYDIYAFSTGYYNVLTYGAVGDSVTDDTTKIQDAIDAAVAAGGGVVFFPSGTYLISSALLVSDEVTLLGMGITSEIYAVSDINMVHHTHSSGVKLNNVSIISLYFKRRITGGSRPTKYHIELVNAVRVLLRDLVLDDTLTAVTYPTGSAYSYDIAGIYFAESGTNGFINWVDRCYIYGHVRFDCSDSKITNCYIYGHSSNCALYLNGSAISVIGNDITIGPALANIYITSNGSVCNIQGNHIDGGSAFQPPSHGIYNLGAFGTNIEGNLFYWLKRDAIVIMNSLYCIVANNVFNSNHYSNISATRAAVSCYSAKIDNAPGYSVASGVTMTVDNLPENLWIGDEVTFTGGGVFTLTANAAIGDTTITGDLTVADVVNNELGYKATADIVVGTSTGPYGVNLVQGNIVYNLNELEQTVYSIREANRGSAPGGNQFYNNRISEASALTTGYKSNSFSLDNTSSKRRGNVGFGGNSYASGTVSIPTGNTVAGDPGYDITHGLSYTPSLSDVRINFATDLATRGVTTWWVSSITSTYIRLRFDATTTGSISMSWAVDTP